MRGVQVYEGEGQPARKVVLVRFDTNGRNDQYVGLLNNKVHLGVRKDQAMRFPSKAAAARWLLSEMKPSEWQSGVTKSNIWNLFTPVAAVMT